MQRLRDQDGSPDIFALESADDDAAAMLVGLEAFLNSAAELVDGRGLVTRRHC